MPRGRPMLSLSTPATTARSRSPGSLEERAASPSSRSWSRTATSTTSCRPRPGRRHRRRGVDGAWRRRRPAQLRAGPYDPTTWWAAATRSRSRASTSGCSTSPSHCGRFVARDRGRCLCRRRAVLGLDRAHRTSTGGDLDTLIESIDPAHAGAAAGRRHRRGHGPATTSSASAPPTRSSSGLR